MQIPTKITFHQVDPSPALEERIREKINKLDERYQGIIGCRVVVDSAHHHSKKGRLYEVRIDITLPGGEIIVSQHPGKNPVKHEKVFAAMNDAFSAVERQIIRFKEQQSNKVKQHEPHWRAGEIAKLIDYENCGFIMTPEEEEVYFHRNALADIEFEQLDAGVKVKFVLAEGEGEKGPQASVVKIVSH